MSYFAALNGGGTVAAPMQTQQIYQQQQTVSAIKKELKGTPLANIKVFVPGGQFGNVASTQAVEAARQLARDPAAMNAIIRDAQSTGLLPQLNVAPDGSLGAGLFNLNVSPWLLAGIAGISLLGIWFVSRKDS